MSRGSASLGRPYWTIWIAASVSFIGDGITFAALVLADLQTIPNAPTATTRCR